MTVDHARPGPPLRFTGPSLTPSVRTFLANEAGSGAVLLGATVVALIWANTPWWPSYAELWHTPVSLRVGGWALEMDLLHVVNDAAMAIFFLVLGLEISREVVVGELRDRRTVMVPALGALGGMAIPVGIFLLFNPGQPEAHGWGVVMSTDTAFLLGVLALFGPACPDRLRLFLLTLAVVDDIGAITVMALAYTDSVYVPALVVAAVLVVLIGILRWLGFWRLTPYVVIAIALWFAIHASGVHATLAGVLVGLLIPARPPTTEQVQRLVFFGRALIEQPTARRSREAILAAAASVSANERLQRALHRWSAYLVIPVFGLANAGVHLSGDVVAAAVTSSVTIGIAVALIVGNMVGIYGASLFALRARLGVLPGRVRYSHLLGGSILAGMGFTISLFITDLAYDDAALRDQAKIGILAGSLLAAVAGAWVLRFMGRRWPLCSPDSETAPPTLPPLPWTSPPASS